MRLVGFYLILLFPFFGFISGYYFLYVFLQKKEIEVPSLIGRNLRDCIKEVSKKGLSLKLLREQEDSDLPQGVILQQIPSTHQKIRPNQSVLVTISKKPKPTITPNFVGLSHNQINLNTKKAGIQSKSFWIKSIYPTDNCICQYPESGFILKNQKLITYLSTGQNSLFIVPNFKDYLIHDVKQNLNCDNISLEILHVKEDWDDFNEQNCFVIDQKPIAGSIVDMNKPLRIQLQVSP